MALVITAIHAHHSLWAGSLPRRSSTVIYSQVIFATRPLEMLRSRRPCGKCERQRQRGSSRWPEQWNNILIYVRSEQWLLCFWSMLSWMTPKQRGRERSHLQLLVTNMAVIRQWWPSQDCRPTLPLPPSAQTHTERQPVQPRVQDSTKLCPRLVYRLTVTLKELSEAERRLLYFWLRWNLKCENMCLWFILSLRAARADGARAPVVAANESIVCCIILYICFMLQAVRN